MKTIDIGFGHLIVLAEIESLLAVRPRKEGYPATMPLGLRHLKTRATEEGRLVDATNGRKTRTIILTKSNRLYFSTIAPETLAERIGKANQNNFINLTH